MQKKLIVFIPVLLLCFLISVLAFARKPTRDPFRRTLDRLQLALLHQDYDVINKHLALESIVTNKIRQLAQSAKKDSSSVKKWAGKLASFTAPTISKATTKLILSQYGKSSLNMRQTYFDQFRIKKTTIKGDKAWASCTFLDQPASLYAKKIKGQWVVVGVSSAIVEAELKSLMNLK